MEISGPAHPQRRLCLLLRRAERPGSHLGFAGNRPWRAADAAQFGCGIHDMVFAPDSPATQGNIQHLVKDALTQWEPRIDVLDVTVTSTPGEENTVLIRVDYRIRSNNAFGNMVYPFYITEGAGN